MPLYGRTFTLRDSSQTSVGSSHSGPGIAGVYTSEPGFIGYHEVCVRIKYNSQLFFLSITSIHFVDMREEIIRTLDESLGTTATSTISYFRQQLD